MTQAPAVAPARVSIEGRSLGHRYGRRTGLEVVSFRLQSPGIATVSGANGAGKSTLLRIMAGLLRPSSGTLHLELDGRALDDAGRRGACGFASPDLHFYEELSAGENLQFAAEARALRDPAATVRTALTAAGLETRSADRVAALSSGMRQRLRLAFALLASPPVLLLDEPGSHLDDEGRAALHHVVRAAASSTLVVIATNDATERALGEQRIELRGRGLGDPS
jgi:heme exporter protein A